MYKFAELIVELIQCLVFLSLSMIIVGSFGLIVLYAISMVV